MLSSQEQQLYCTCGTILHSAPSKQKFYCESCLTRECTYIDIVLKKQGQDIQFYKKCLQQYQNHKESNISYQSQLKQSIETNYDSNIKDQQLLNNQVQALEKQLSFLILQSDGFYQKEKQLLTEIQKDCERIQKNELQIFKLRKQQYVLETLLEEQLRQMEKSFRYYQKLSSENMLASIYDISFEDDHSLVNGEIITLKNIQIIAQIMHCLQYKAITKGYAFKIFYQYDFSQSIIAIKQLNKQNQQTIREIQLKQWKEWLPIICYEMEQLINELSKKHFESQMKPPYKIDGNGMIIGGLEINYLQSEFKVIRCILYDLKHIINMYYYIDSEENQCKLKLMS